MFNNKENDYQIKHNLLNCYTINILKKNRITTIVHFLHHSIDNLKKLINLTYREIVTIKKDFIRLYAIVPINGLTYYKDIIELFQCLSTGIKNFDKLLDGGLITGNLYEICGLPGIGKTQLCQTVALRLSTHYKMKTLWIDTTNHFSAIRLKKMILYDYDHDVRGNCIQKIDDRQSSNIVDILNRFIIQSVTDPVTFLDTLKYIRTLLMNECSTGDKSQIIKLIIIDSLPAIWFLFLGNISKGKTFLMETANILRQLANEYNLVIIIVNILTRWTNVEHDKLTKNDEHHKVAMGKICQSIPSTRFLIRSLAAESMSVPSSIITSNININTNQILLNTKQLEIEIIKSNQFKIGDRCKVMLTNKGIV